MVQVGRQNPGERALGRTPGTTDRAPLIHWGALPVAGSGACIAHPVAPYARQARIRVQLAGLDRVKGLMPENGRRAFHHAVPAHTPGIVNERSST